MTEVLLDPVDDDLRELGVEFTDLVVEMVILGGSGFHLASIHMRPQHHMCSMHRYNANYFFLATEKQEYGEGNAAGISFTT